ncbi:MAG: sigma-54 dependent transcriptional regulator, partial [Bacteroidota bacterium]
FVVKPWDNDDLQKKVHQAIQQSDVAPSPAPEQGSVPSFSSHQISPRLIGQSPAFLEVMETARKVAETDANVLLLGENGTGKQLFAEEIHRLSHRRDAAFMHVDLGSIAPTLFESELFGHTKGAFTDAREDRMGRFEAANHGTLFLDEIGNLPFALQAKLLSALQNRSCTRIGSNQPIPIDIRLISATNQALEEMIRASQFRQDLFYRINTLRITLPPLRERKADIPLLITHFLQAYARQYQKQILEVPDHIFESLQSYHWPGNIRELQHATERAVIMDQVESLLPVPSSPAQTAQASPLPDEDEASSIRNILDAHAGNIRKAAEQLGMSRNTLYRKMRKYDL